MNLAAIDLNLLVALRALLSEASVGRAAARLGLSQPAASHALRRLRELIGDPLLVRVGSAMELTPRAEALRVPLDEVLQGVERLLVADSFDPVTSGRCFRVMMPDHVFDLLLPPLMARLKGAAPGVSLDARPWKGARFMGSELARQIDVVVACAADDFAGFHRERLFTDTDALAVRRGHPALSRLGELECFLNTGHVAVVGVGQREDLVDAWLRDVGVRRRVDLAAPSYLQALHMVARTDLVAVIPRRLVEALAEPLGLEALAPPLDPGTFDEFMFHPSRAHVEPGSVWFRAQVRAVGRALGRRGAMATAA